MSNNDGPLPPNPTENQHFIAQKIQSLNASAALNGEVSHIRAYCRVGEHALVRANRDGMPIRHNLALKDLYTFDLTGKMRRNFEDLFHRYESNVPRLTLSLLEKIRAGQVDIRQEIFAILSAKFLDFARNPYTIRKCLNTFPPLANHHPTDPESYNTYRRIWDGYNPRQTRICELLGVTEDEYRRWLVTLFMLLYPHVGMTETFLDQVIAGLISNKENYTSANVFVFDQPAVLLSDRSFNEVSSSSCIVLEFHASAEMFITFSSTNMGDMGLPKDRLALFKANRVPQLEVPIIENNYEQLERYNQRSVTQCFKHVYGAASSFPGVVISVD